MKCPSQDSVLHKQQQCMQFFPPKLNLASVFNGQPNPLAWEWPAQVQTLDLCRRLPRPVPPAALLSGQFSGTAVIKGPGITIHQLRCIWDRKTKQQARSAAAVHGSPSKPLRPRSAPCRRRRRRVAGLLQLFRTLGMLQARRGAAHMHQQASHQEPGRRASQVEGGGKHYVPLDPRDGCLKPLPQPRLPHRLERARHLAQQLLQAPDGAHQRALRATGGSAGRLLCSQPASVVGARECACAHVLETHGNARQAGRSATPVAGGGAAGRTVLCQQCSQKRLVLPASATQPIGLTSNTSVRLSSSAKDRPWHQPATDSIMSAAAQQAPWMGQGGKADYAQHGSGEPWEGELPARHSRSLPPAFAAAAASAPPPAPAAAARRCDCQYHVAPLHTWPEAVHVLLNIHLHLAVGRRPGNLARSRAQRAVRSLQVGAHLVAGLRHTRGRMIMCVVWCGGVRLRGIEVGGRRGASHTWMEPCRRELPHLALLPPDEA